MKKVFISHSSNDKPFVRKLAKALSSSGIESWIDESEIKYGESLISKISSSIEEIDLIIAIISPDSIKSSWVRKELEWAMTKEINSRKISVIPILIKKCDIPFFLSDKLYADFIDPNTFSKNIIKLTESIKYHSGEDEVKSTENKIGEHIIIKNNPTNFSLKISFLLILLAVVIGLATFIYSQTSHTIENFPLLKAHIFTFAVLLIGLQFAEIIRILLIYSAEIN